MLGELICDAIQRRQLLEFRYAKDELLRVVEPHQYGATADGHELVLAWLVRSESTGSDQNGWRLYRTDQIIDMRALPETFVVARPGFNPSARYFAITHCTLLDHALPDRRQNERSSSAEPTAPTGGESKPDDELGR